MAWSDEGSSRLSQQLGNVPALVVVVSSGAPQDVATVTRLAEETPWTVFWCGPSSAASQQLRRWAEKKHCLGQRVYIVEGAGRSLWLADDMADAVWVLPKCAAPLAGRKFYGFYILAAFG